MAFPLDASTGTAQKDLLRVSKKVPPFGYGVVDAILVSLFGGLWGSDSILAP